MLHEFEDGACTTCKYKEGTPIEEDAGVEEDGAKLNWPILVMLGLVCFGLATTATVLILKRKK